MKPLLTIPESFHPKFEKMWRSACKVCDSIRAFQPDLILALMHSGWGPVYAAQIVWQKTQTMPFPPIARPNIGREKIGIFEETFNLFSTDCFNGEYSSVLHVGKLLAWITSRTDWRDQLQQQVADAIQSSSDPQRILVVDDCIHEGSTSILTLGLLNWVFPQAQVLFLNANSWYRSEYTDFMLESIYPRTELFPDGIIPSDEIRIHLGRVAIGTDNDSDESLFWQPVTIDNPSVKALSVYRPAEDWVQVSATIFAVIALYIAGHAESYIPQEPDLQYSSLSLRIPWLIMRDIWLENETTRREVELRYGLSNLEARRILERWREYDEVALEGHGRGARYVIPAALRHYIDKLEEPPDDPYEAYWLLPDRLMFGDRPWFTDNPQAAEYASKEIHYLLDRGVDCWLDVQVIQEGISPKENPFFLEEAREIGRSVIVQIVPLELQYVNEKNYILFRYHRPNRKDIYPILDQIDQFITERRVIYVSASYRSLSGILAGCYLARHGQAGVAALDALQVCRATGSNGWKREPASGKARRYIRSWPAGC